ncbi:DUF3307 domain-containing protein [Streptantibioticus silvisoli]|uniref:DUF3307 domain-containing protein n=1 Tax=Streptantibioticus silvisoli TaxID=2705255 RepID=A0ABT6W4Q9_9ACTN|nr:DUF3307 domain-containing protein [Streptantibioticus silvisoli]MDI5965745.1 DUF3307 domain-containing protein [Streptantibioticus silvisoli]
MFAALFILLYVAHLAADYPGQTDHQAGHKADPGWAGWAAAFAHAGTHAALTAVALGIATVTVAPNLTLTGAIVGTVWVTATHALIDRRWIVAWWMDNTGQAAFRARGGAAHVDQAAHVLMLAVAAGLITAL